MEHFVRKLRKQCECMGFRADLEFVLNELRVYGIPRDESFWHGSLPITVGAVLMVMQGRGCNMEAALAEFLGDGKGAKRARRAVGSPRASRRRRRSRR